jgi:hypothetical protein
MGAEISHFALYGSIYKNPSMARFRPEFEVLHMKEWEVGKLFRTFNKMGLKSNAFYINEIELCAHIRMRSTVLLRKLMSVDDSHPIVAFENFVRGLWKLCTVIQIKELGTFSFITHFALFQKKRLAYLTIPQTIISASEMYIRAL